MDQNTMKKFKEYYANRLRNEAESFQAPLPSIEEEFQRISRKNKNGKVLKKAESNRNNVLKETLYVEKLQSFVNGSDNKELKDLEVLNELADYNEDAKRELASLREGQYASQALKNRKPQDQPEIGTGMVTYQRIQKVVDKVIQDTVLELRTDLNILPDKQRSLSIIDRLSGIKNQHSDSQMKNSSVRSVERLPTLENTGHAKGRKSVVLSSGSPSVVLPTGMQSPSLSGDGGKEKSMAGFRLKEKKQKHKVDREKEQIRRDCIENFVKNEKIKNISQQYLSTLTNHNVSSLENLSYNNLDTAPLYSSQYLQSPVSRKSIFGKVEEGIRSARVLKSYGAVENGSSVSIPYRRGTLKGFTQIATKNNDAQNYFAQSPTKMASPRKRFTKKLEPFSVDKKGNLRENFAEEVWMREGGLGEALARKDEYIFEGMGLLTLHTEYKNAAIDLKELDLKHFNMAVKTLKRKDMDYIQKKTGVNLKHSLYDRVVSEKDVMRFESKDLKMLF